MDRYWLITWTCYGTWLPGARQGFVSHVSDEHGDLVIHNVSGTPFDADMPALEAHARSIMNGPPVSLDQSAADAMIAQYQETCNIRGWELQAASVMYNHTHLVVGVLGDPEPASIRETFKSWATRAVKSCGRCRPTALSGRQKVPPGCCLTTGPCATASFTWRGSSRTHSPCGSTRSGRRQLTNTTRRATTRRAERRKASASRRGEKLNHRATSNLRGSAKLET